MLVLSLSRTLLVLLCRSLSFSLLVVVIWVFCVVVSPHTAAYIIMRTEAVSVYLWQVLVMAWQMLSNVPPHAPPAFLLLHFLLLLLLHFLCL